MNWEAIYWHVWAACQVFRTNYVSISALETDKYDLEDDGVLINIKYFAISVVIFYHIVFTFLR